MQPSQRLKSILAHPTTVNRFFLAFVLVSLLGVVRRYVFYDARDPSKCGALLTEGLWLDRPRYRDVRIPTEWQPPGCMVHSYKPAEVSTCLRKRRLTFIGDSTVRQMFWGVAKKLDSKVNTTMADKHKDIQREIKGVTLEFVWDPFLNSTVVRNQLKMFNAVEKPDSEDSRRPAILFIGTGLWYARFKSLNGFKAWRDNIDDIAGLMAKPRKTTDMARQDLALLAPVPVPAWDKLSEERKKAITPDMVNEMNEYLQQLSDIHDVVVPWSLHKMTADLPSTFEESGIHVEQSVVMKQVEVLLNLRCNGRLPPKYPYDRTCCNRYEPPNFQQWSGLVLVLAILPILSYLRGKAETEGTKAAGFVPSEKITHALLVFGLAVVYCFYADRTQVFNKSHKLYTDAGFGLLSAIALTIGLVTIRKSSQTASDQPFLFRDQTDEWKGWMQAAILIYHYVGASKIPWIYGFIRVTVASYLFMTGYGHTIYFYKKGDYSFKRVASVLIRLNMLSCVLPYMMKTDYIFYYFAPLVSFWFLVVYMTMRVGSQRNKDTKFLISKILISAALVTFFNNFPGILEIVFKIPEILASTHWSVKEWRFRVFLDMWIVYVGMIVAIVFIRLSDTTSSYSNSFPTLRKYALVASAIALPSYLLFQITRENKFVYNAYHPYTSWIPILSFVVLRNATPQLRNAYSGAFAWLGKCSLETFTLQFHIWLAADTKGILNLGIFGDYSRISNFIVATIMFLYISQCVALATGDLTAWVMGISARPPSKPQTPALPVFNKNNENTGVDTMTQRSAPPPPPQPTWFSDIRIRCALLLALMWILNLTYSS